MYKSKDSILFNDDCLNVLKKMPDNYIDTIICDPPYALNFMCRAWDKVLPSIDIWKECLRVSKPGTFILSFGGTKTFHRLGVLLEDAGWVGMDCICWLYGSGFPKSYNIAKGITKVERGFPQGVSDPTSSNHGKYKSGCSKENPHGRGFGAGPGKFMKEKVKQNIYDYIQEAEQWIGYGTALKPAWEPILVFMKEKEGTYVQNALEHGVAGLNIDGCRVEGSCKKWEKHRGGMWRTGSTATANLIDSTKGRWPANVILDEESGKLLDEQSGISKSSGGRTCNISKTSEIYGGGKGLGQNIDPEKVKGDPGFGDVGGASRFFYCAKASKSERNKGCEELYWLDGKSIEKEKWIILQQENIDHKEDRGYKPHILSFGNIHPTVKPLKLMEYLVRLTKTPTGGVVFDPFMGSGTTGVACITECRKFIGVESEKESYEIAKSRITNKEK